MQKMRFSKLSLLSQKEQRGLQIDFGSDRTVLVAGNGFGKSAILKSLYETLGAKPHKIDQSWTEARVTSLLEFSIDARSFAALKVGNNFTVYDEKKSISISTNHVTAELGPHLAELLDFRLVLTDKKEEIRTPPPSYAFAPFYVDQDRSWQRVWDSFKDLSMFSNSPRSLAEYHSGLRPNAYYEAKAKRDQIKAELVTIETERQALHQALKKIRESMTGAPLALTLDSFIQDTERLVSEGRILHTEQAKYRSELAALNEEHQLWRDHVSLVESALQEIDDTFTGSLEQPSDVECPMCGQHYQNQIADQFELVADKEDLLLALQSGRTHLKDVHDRLTIHRQKLDRVTNSIDRIQEVLAVKRGDISLRDVIAAEGRVEAQRYFQDRLASLDVDYGIKSRIMAESEQRMAEADNRKRKGNIRSYFSKQLQQFAANLDVRLPDANRLNLQGLHIGRGSEGPRALAAYYYAFLQTAHEYGSSTFCPIVIDAPNQQGQDAGHLQTIMEFLLTKAPFGSQVIIGAETFTPVGDVNVIDISWKKDRVLREDAYAQTLKYVEPFLQQSLL
jgi:hypothetical protein